MKEKIADVTYMGLLVLLMAAFAATFSEGFNQNIVLNAGFTLGAVTFLVSGRSDFPPYQILFLN
jgi:xanthine/uracil permease